MAALFDDGGSLRRLRPRRRLGRDVRRRRGVPRAAYDAACSPRCSRFAAGGAALPRRPAEPDLHRPRGDLRARRRGAAVPARPRAAGHRRRRVGPSSSAAYASGCGRSRRSSPTSTAPGEVFADGVVPRSVVVTSRALPPRRRRHRAAQRRARARRRHRPGPRRGRATSGCSRTTCASPSGVSYVIENRAAMTPAAARAVRRRTASSRSTTTRPGCWPRCGPSAPDGRRRPDRRRAHAGRLQLRLLRARAARPPDGRRAGRGPRPGLRGQPGQHADDGGRAARRRRLPPHRRRLPRPAALPARLGARLPGHRSTPPAPATSRSPTRSATASPTTSCVYTYVPGPDPLLPAARSRCSTTSRRTGSTTPTCVEWVLDRLDQLVLKPVDGSGGKGIVIGPHGRRARRSTELRGDGRGRPAGLDRAAAGRRCRPAPTLVGDRIAPRHVDLRPFAVNDGDDVWVLPGGLTRVALPGGRARRQLQPGRRVQGHLGARPRDAGRRRRADVRATGSPVAAADADDRAPDPRTVGDAVTRTSCRAAAAAMRPRC